LPAHHDSSMIVVVTRSVERGLAGFERTTFRHDGIEHDVFRAGSGPAVVVIHEVPGIHPGVVAFARRVMAEGFTAYLPSLFGSPGRDISTGYTLGVLVRTCVAREFTILATNRTAPVISWLRALVAKAHDECGGPGVGAVGMCFTGGYALGMAIDERMLAPVLSQPSLPAAFGARRAADVGISAADLELIKQRTDGTCVLGLRFSQDRAVPDARFATLKRELGDRFIAVDIDSSTGNPHGIPSDAHSVLTAHLVDEAGHPTRDALDRVLTLFRDRLLTSGRP
jgi:dienelactone hydrolase